MSGLIEHLASLLAHALAPLLTLVSASTGSSTGTADLVAAATAALAALLVASAAIRLSATPRTSTHDPAAAGPASWREKARRFQVPRACDPDAPGRQRPRAPSAPLPVA